MRFLAKEKLSEHKYKTSEGYLVCVDAVLSRTGKQQYRRGELFGDSCERADDMIDVDRLEADVFDEKAMASFENKPICVEHPEEDVNVANHNELAVGFVRDIKRGIDNGQPVMLGTLVITDENAIDLIESGEYAELSCGYDCDIVDDEHPAQKNIRGNHVALCQHGRAGIARIVDSTNDDLYGLIKEPVKRYYLAKNYDKKWDIEENIVIIAKNISEAEQKLKRRFPDAYNLREISHSEYLKFRRGNVIIDSVNDDTLVSADKLKVGMRINYRGKIYTVENIAQNKLYSGEYDLTLKADDGSRRVLETGSSDRFSVVDSVEDFAVMRFDFSTNIAAFERAIVNNDVAEFEAMLPTFEKDIRDYNAWKAEGKLSAADVGKVKRQINKINSLLAKSSINKRFEVNDMATLKDDEYVQLPRGRFKLVAKTKEELENEGYGYHHSDNGYSVYVKNNSAVAIKDAVVCDAKVYAAGEHSQVGNDFYGYILVEHPKLGDFYVSVKIKRGRNEVQLDGTGWSFIKSKGYTSEQKAWIAAHKAELERMESVGVIKDSLKSFEVSFVKDGVTYVRKVKATDLSTAIKLANDAYNKYEHETDKEFLKSAISEMRRYISNWSFMSAREKRNIAPNGFGSLKQDLSFAEKRLAELK